MEIFILPQKCHSLQEAPNFISCFHPSQSEEVAKKLVDDALQGKFSSTVGFEGFMLTTLCGGMGPVTDSFSFLAQVYTAQFYL